MPGGGLLANLRLEELRRRWDEEHEKLRELVRMYRQKASYNADMASRLQAAVTRLRRFEQEGPPEQAPRSGPTRASKHAVRRRIRGETPPQTGVVTAFPAGGPVRSVDVRCSA